MKQKVVINVFINDKKCRTKAIRTAVGVHGVTQAALQQDKGQIEVTGDGIDVVELTNRLRKSLKYADLVSVTPVEAEKEEENKKKKCEPPQPVCPVWQGVPVVCGVMDPYKCYQDPYYKCYQDPYYKCYQDPSCTVM